MTENRSTRLQRQVINVLVRCFGALSVVCGSISILSSFLMDQDRSLYQIVGVLAVIWGVAFLRAKLITEKDIQSREQSNG
jgi:hypothetical protein